MAVGTEVLDDFDAFFRDAFPRGSVTLLYTPLGPEKEAILVPLCLQALREGTTLFLALSTIPPKRILKRLYARDSDPQKALESGQLRVLDWYSHKEEEVLERKDEGGILTCPQDLRSLDAALSKIVKASKGGGMAVLEIITDLLVRPSDKLGKFVSILGRKLRKSFVTSVLAVDRDLLPSEMAEKLTEISDGSVMVKRRRTPEGVSWTAIASRGGDESRFKLLSDAPFTEFSISRLKPAEGPPAEAFGEPCPQCGTLIEGAECTLCGYAPGDDQRWKTQEIYQKVDERLRKNPTDLNALYTKAAALARMNDYREAINVLNELTIHDPRYPGMWMLKAKLYDRLGEEAKANLCRHRALSIKQMEVGAVGDTAAVADGEEFQCPLCLKWLPWNATICTCGAEFVED